jgi:hypothetical protein
MADDIPLELSDAALLARANRAAMAGQPGGYTSSVFPFSYDAQGRRSWDWNAGIPGMLQRAVTVPSDVVSGNIPVIGPDAQVNPELIRRSTELAGLIASPNPAVVAGDRAIPGQLLAGQRPVPVPTADALKTAGGAGYDAARAAGLDIAPEAAVDMAQRLQAELFRQGRGVTNAPKTNEILSGIAAPPAGGFNTVDDYLAMRRSFNNVTGDPSDMAAAGQGRRAIDELLGSIQPEQVRGGTMEPQAVADILRSASGNYAAAMRSNELAGTLDRANTGILERAETRAGATNSGRNLDNTIRQRVASFLESPKNVAGLSDTELDALRGVVGGGRLQNALRYISNLMGGGGGLGQGVMAGLGGAAGASTGNPLLAFLGAAAPATTGALMKTGENALAKRSLNAVDEMMRMRSPLYEQGLLAPQPITPQYRGTMETLRGLLPMLMAPPQRPPARPWTPADAGYY